MGGPSTAGVWRKVIGLAKESNHAFDGTIHTIEYFAKNIKVSTFYFQYSHAIHPESYLCRQL